MQAIYTKSSIWTAIILCLTQGLSAQLFQQNSHYLYDIYQFNPAYAGLERSLSVNFNYRDQWSAFDKQPSQFYLNAHMPVYLFGGGIGVSAFSDQVGLIETSAINLSYNRVIKRPQSIISAGLSLGISNSKLAGDQIITPEGIYLDGIIDHQDQILTEASLGQLHFDYTLGIFIGHDQFDLGLSLKNLFSPDYKVGLGQFDNYRHFSTYFKKSIYFNEYEVSLSTLIKTNFLQVQTDITSIVKHGSVFGGVSLRGINQFNFDALVMIAGMQLNPNYRIVYSYDIAISSINKVSSGSHEISINYNLNKLIGLGLPPKVIYNPRNL